MIVRAYSLQGQVPMSFDTYVVTTIDDLRKVVEDLPTEMGVEIAEGVSITAATVRQLRAIGSFPSGKKLRVITPRERYPESVVKIELAE
jgi:hypothetical protein